MAGLISREGELWTQWLEVVRRQPRKVVVVEAETGASWTAKTLTEDAVRQAESRGNLRAGERVAFRMANSASWLACFLALQRSGLTAIPLDSGIPDAGCREMARRFRARMLYLGEVPEELPTAPVPRKAPACLKVTSGSGAQPKAVACAAGQLLADGRQIIRTMRLRATDINLAAIPLGHSYGLGNLVMPLILQGTALVCADRYVPRQIVEWIARYHVTVFPGVPALFRVLSDLPLDAGAIQPLRTTISAGAVLSPAVAQAFHRRYGRKIHNFYGSSETGGICYDRSGQATLTGRSVGLPLEGVSVTVKSRRITVASAAVATRTKRWRASDFGAWNARGELVLLGRAGQEANIGGKKVHPLEIERVLRALPGVTDAVVWLEQKQGRDFIAAAVESRRSRVRIEHALAARLPAWKCPKICLVLRALPRTGRGKIDLAALREKVRPGD